MFGIPTDPRLIEVLGWLLYAVPVLVVFLWPARYVARGRGEGPDQGRYRGGARRRRRGHGACSSRPRATASPGPTRAVVTVGRRGCHRDPAAPRHRRALLTVTADGKDRQVPLAAAGQQTIDGLDVDVWQATAPADPGVTTTPITLGQLADLDRRPAAGRTGHRAHPGTVRTRSGAPAPSTPSSPTATTSSRPRRRAPAVATLERRRTHRSEDRQPRRTRHRLGDPRSRRRGRRRQHRQSARQTEPSERCGRVWLPTVLGDRRHLRRPRRGAHGPQHPQERKGTDSDMVNTSAPARIGVA